MKPDLPAKIVHLTSVHFPFDTRIFHRECKTLSAAGYETVLIAPHDRCEVLDGLRVRAVTKPKNRWSRLFRTIPEVFRAALEEKADLYHFHDPELIPLGIWFKTMGRRVVYDVHEDVPRQIASKPYIARWVRPLLSAGASLSESICAQIVDGIVAATPEIARRFPARKTATVQNFPILGELDAPQSVPYRERPFHIAYVGVIAVPRGAREMVRAMERLPEGSSVRLMLAGNMSPVQLSEELESMGGWGRVEYLGWQSRPEVAAILGRARVGLLALHPLANYLDSYPVKLFEYMSVGIPVIASDFSLWREIIEQAQCGLLVDPFDTTAIAEGIEWMLNNPEEAEQMGRRGKEAAVALYNWRTEAEKLFSMYKEILS